MNKNSNNSQLYASKNHSYYDVVNEICKFHALDIYSKDILLYMCSFANNGKSIFPGYREIGRRIHCSPRTVMRRIRQLIDLELIQKFKRFDESGNGRQTSNIYSLCFNIFSSLSRGGVTGRQSITINKDKTKKVKHLTGRLIKRSRDKQLTPRQLLDQLKQPTQSKAIKALRKEVRAWGYQSNTTVNDIIDEFVLYWFDDKRDNEDFSMSRAVWVKKLHGWLDNRSQFCFDA